MDAQKEWPKPEDPTKTYAYFDEHDSGIMKCCTCNTAVPVGSNITICPNCGRAVVFA